MSVSWLVTIHAIRGYLSKARQARQQFNEAAEEMKKAAADLCSKWEGDAAVAFEAEQNKFNGWCKQMDGIGSEYMTALNKAIDVYEKTEQAVKHAITSK